MKALKQCCNVAKVMTDRAHAHCKSTGDVPVSVRHYFHRSIFQGRTLFWFTPTLRVWTPPMLSRFGSFNCGEEERLLTVNFLASLAVGVVVAIASHSDPFPSSIKRAMPKKGAQMKGGQKSTGQLSRRLKFCSD